MSNTDFDTGLHPEEAISYLEKALLEHQSSSRPLYAITGTGHHSKGGRVKVTKAVRIFLDEWHYAYREFSVPGDKNSHGGILGIVPNSYDRSVSGRDGGVINGLARNSDSIDGVGGNGNTQGQYGVIGQGKVRVLKREEVKGTS